MKDKLFYHIEFLVSSHNCVIVPGLGGFVLNQNSSTISGFGLLSAPRYSISFNAELNHDDGILTSHMSRCDKLPYNLTSQKIKYLVKAMHIDLQTNKLVRCGNLGILHPNKNNKGSILFEMSRAYIHPSLFGLAPLEIKKIEKISRLQRREKKHISLKQAIGSIAAAVVGIVLLITPSGSIKDNTVLGTQQAGYIKSLSSLSSSGEDGHDDASLLSANAYHSAQSAEKYTYYIILAGDAEKSKAEEKLVTIRQESFPNAKILDADNRHRVYVASFADKSEAENFLDDFKKINPAYDNAWLYSHVEQLANF